LSHWSSRSIRDGLGSSADKIINPSCNCHSDNQERRFSLWNVWNAVHERHESIIHRRLVRAERRGDVPAPSPIHSASLDPPEDLKHMRKSTRRYCPLPTVRDDNCLPTSFRGGPRGRAEIESLEHLPILRSFDQLHHSPHFRIAAGSTLPSTFQPDYRRAQADPTFIIGEVQPCNHLVLRPRDKLRKSFDLSQD